MRWSRLTSWKTDIFSSIVAVNDSRVKRSMSVFLTSWYVARRSLFIMPTPPALLVWLRNISLRHISVHTQPHRRTSVYFHHRRFHRATVDQFGRRDESGRETHSFQKSGLLVNCLKPQMNRYAKTSFLQLREDAFESLGGLRWFLPLQAVSLLSKVSTVAFSLARLLERKLHAHS